MKRLTVSRAPSYPSVASEQVYEHHGVHLNYNVYNNHPIRSTLEQVFDW